MRHDGEVALLPDGIGMRGGRCWVRCWDRPGGGADKLGHLYMNYVGTRLFAKLFEWDGNAPAQALQLATVYTLGTFAAVELIDGFSRRWRFGKEDLPMNAAGVGAALPMESNPRLDRLLDLRFQYRPSHEWGQGADPFGDYAGQTYLVVAKASPSCSTEPCSRTRRRRSGLRARRSNSCRFPEPRRWRGARWEGTDGPASGCAP